MPNLSWTKEQFQETVVKVMEKAETDANFRERVLTDVYAAVREVTGNEMPEDFKINVVDGSKYDATLVLPEVKGVSEELTENDLEAVAGGIIAPMKKPSESWEDYSKRLEHYRRIGIVF